MLLQEYFGNSSPETGCDEGDEITALILLETEPTRKKNIAFFLCPSEINKEGMRPLQDHGRLHMEFLLILVVINWRLRRITHHHKLEALGESSHSNL